jgi:hypothetical protein
MRDVKRRFSRIKKTITLLVELLYMYSIIAFFLRRLGWLEDLSELDWKRCLAVYFMSSPVQIGSCVVAAHCIHTYFCRKMDVGSFKTLLFIERRNSDSKCQIQS